MKKAKLTLLLITTFAIAGGVFAGKAKRLDLLFYTYNTNDPAELTATGFTLMPGPITILFNGTYFTAQYGSQATNETIYLGN